ncbi:hypothetical protein C518_2400 [Lysinibacillus fusiformis ZB2]|nr:hypothetical protein C518_2400 [Lysinibacillus fusiformis ZB2]
MYNTAEKLQVNSTPLKHTMGTRGGSVLEIDCISKQESPKVVEKISEIEGKYGTITIAKSSRPIKETDSDIHALIANVLLKREKRLKATGN